MIKKKAFVLIELIVVVGLFSILFSLIIGILINSDTYWNKGQDKITEQFEARRAMQGITEQLRQSNTHWGIFIDNTNNKILFYKPVFNDTGYATNETHWMIFKPDPSNSRLLIRKEQGDSVWSNVANYIESLNFFGSSDRCVTFNSATVSETCPQVKIIVKTEKDKEFTLTSLVSLRNQYFSDATVELPEEGEF